MECCRNSDVILEAGLWKAWRRLSRPLCNLPEAVLLPAPAGPVHHVTEPSLQILGPIKIPGGGPSPAQPAAAGLAIVVTCSDHGR